MKKLVIHPKDQSTVFLNKVYEDLDDVTLVQGGVSKTQLRNMIDQHDQIMMMGHGTPYGLMGVGQFDSYGHIIDDTFADQLSEKGNSVFIWCNADEYVSHNELKGFYTGMFISEVAEARICGVDDTFDSDVEESNRWFVRSVNRAANDEVELMHSYVKQDYGELIHRNPVAKYNHERLYCQ